MTIAQTPLLPGRLGNPDLAPRDDLRVDPRIRAMLAPSSGVALLRSKNIDVDSPIEDIYEFISAMEASSLAEFEGKQGDAGRHVGGLAPIDGVSSSIESITGVDGNAITLYIHRPAAVAGPIPAVVHLHGGGMVMLSADSSLYRRWREELAASNLFVVGVEFRNGAGKHGPHPFPAGLNDTMSAVRWVNQNKRRLGVSVVVTSGESGGGNLAIAAALKANQGFEGDQIDGVYALCPYLSGQYVDRPAALVSLFENDGLPIAPELMSVLARAYDPDGQNATNPLAWPYFADEANLKGLPPHVISVNEVDPMRDEGIAYFRKLLAAGVSAHSRTVNGTFHATENYYIRAVPDIAGATISDLARFAHSL